MRFTFVLAAVLLLASAAHAQKPKKTAKPEKTALEQTTPATATTVPAIELLTTQDSVSYALGMNIGMNLQMQKIEVTPELVAAGLKLRYSAGKTLLTEEQAMNVMMGFQTRMQAKQQAEHAASGAVNKAEGEKFLAENAKKDGVKVTASGLQYKVITEGKGPIPTAADKVRTHYRGTLINGKQFDSSYDRGEPVEFPVSNVIKGWTEALQLMPVGSKWQLFIPSQLAYGENGAGADIGPNSVLIFDIELLDIVK